MNLDKTYVYYSNIDLYQDESIFNKDLSLVSQERKEKILKYKFKEDQYLSLGVYILYLKVLDIFEIKNKDIKIGEHGKPYVDGYYFNFSHSGNRIMVAISNMPVGCDVEKIENEQPALAKYVLTENEQKQVINKTMFYRFWTLKESYLKALGVGVSKKFNSFEIDLSTYCIKNALSSDVYHLYEYFLDDGYCYSLASQNKNITNMEFISLK